MTSASTSFSLRFLLATLSIIGLLLTFSGASAQPRLTVAEGLSFDLGNVREGIVTKRTLTLSNAGTDTLMITDVTTSCGCTSAKPGKRSLAPGETTTIPVTINSKGFRGKVRREVRVVTNDPRTPMTIVSFHSVIRAEIEYAPGYINFSETAKGATVTRTVVLYNRTDARVRLKSVKAEDRNISGKFSRGEIAPGDSVILTVTFRPVERGEAKGRLKIATDRKGSEDLTISYIARVR